MRVERRLEPEDCEYEDEEHDGGVQHLQLFLSLATKEAIDQRSCSIE